MANLYAAYKEGGRTQAEEKKIGLALSNYDFESKLIDWRSQVESEKVSEVTGTIADSLSLASQGVGMVGDTLENVKKLEGEYGELNTDKVTESGEIKKESIFGKMWRGAKMTAGIGEYKFGDTSIKASDFESTVAKIDYKNMFEEAMSDKTKVEDPIVTSSDETISSNNVLNKQENQIDYTKKIQDTSKELKQDLYKQSTTSELIQSDNKYNDTPKLNPNYWNDL
mgnify:CR=1 FL=1